MNVLVASISRHYLAEKYLRGEGLIITTILLLPFVARSGLTNASFEGSVGIVAAMFYFLGYAKAAWEPFEHFREARSRSFFRGVVLRTLVFYGFVLAFPIAWVVGSLSTPEATDNLLRLLALWWGS